MTENSEALSKSLVESTRLWLFSLSSTRLDIRYYVVKVDCESSSSIPNVFRSVHRRDLKKEQAGPSQMLRWI